MGADTETVRAPNGDGPAPRTRAERRAAKEESSTSAPAAAKKKAPLSGFRRTADLTGRILIGAGVILLLFTAYQLWGTSIQESHAQNQLRKQLTSETHHTKVVHALKRGHRAGTTLPGPGPPVTAPAHRGPARGQPGG